MLKPLTEMLNEQKWNTVVISPKRMEVLDEKKKQILKVENETRRKQIKNLASPKERASQKTKIYETKLGRSQSYSEQNEAEELEEGQEPVFIVKRKEIETYIKPKNELSSSEEEEGQKLVDKKVIREKVLDNPNDLLRKSKGMKESIDVKEAPKPDFKMKHGIEYIEEQKTTTYGQEILKQKKLRLVPLLDRDEYIFTNEEAEKDFKNQERKLVAKRREQYANRGKGQLKDIVTTSVERRKLRASVILQRWFRNRKSVIDARNSVYQQGNRKSILKGSPISENTEDLNVERKQAVSIRKGQSSPENSETFMSNGKKSPTNETVAHEEVRPAPLKERKKHKKNQKQPDEEQFDKGNLESPNNNEVNEKAGNLSQQEDYISSGSNFLTTPKQIDGPPKRERRTRKQRKQNNLSMSNMDFYNSPINENNNIFISSQMFPNSKEPFSETNKQNTNENFSSEEKSSRPFKESNYLDNATNRDEGKSKDVFERTERLKSEPEDNINKIRDSLVKTQMTQSEKADPNRNKSIDNNKSESARKKTGGQKGISEFEKELRKQPIYESPQNINLDLANEIISKNKIVSPRDTRKSLGEKPDEDFKPAKSTVVRQSKPQKKPIDLRDLRSIENRAARFIQNYYQFKRYQEDASSKYVGRAIGRDKAVQASMPLLEDFINREDFRNFVQGLEKDEQFNKAHQLTMIFYYFYKKLEIEGEAGEKKYLDLFFPKPCGSPMKAGKSSASSKK